MTTDNEKGPLNQMESGQQKRSASEARALSEIVNGTPSENLCRRGSPAPKQASETTEQQPRTYTTQPAESVMGIALRQCGNEMEWRHILACNPEFARMLPHEYFPVGTVLNLPPHPAAASRFEQPEKSLAPEGGSEARGRWIQANCPTGDIIKSPSPSNNREFPTSMSESDCEHRIALAPAQPAAAAIENAELASVTRMFHAACADLGLINEALGLDPEDGGAAPILEAIEELKARAPSPADDRALPMMRNAFRVTEVSGDPDPVKQRFYMRFSFRSIDALHAADDEWRKFVAAPVSALADAAEARLTNEQRDVLTWAIGRANAQGEDACADVLRSILASQPGQPEPSAEVTDAARDVLCERRRQVEQEGWTPEHDEKHRDHELSCAAGCYAMHTLAYPAGDPPPAWPWGADWWKPTTHRRNLVKAGALILAEIEKIDRAAARSGDAS